MSFSKLIMRCIILTVAGLSFTALNAAETENIFEQEAVKNKAAEKAIEREAKAIRQKEHDIWNNTLNASNEKTAEKKVKLAAELEVERLKAQSQADKAKVQAAEAKEKQAKDDLIREKAKANAELEATKAKVQAAEAEKEKIMAELEAEKAKLKAEAEKKAEKETQKANLNNSEEEENSFCNFLATVGKNILWYIPKRLSDFMDIFTIEAGVGEIGAGIQLTRYASFGAGVGQRYMLGMSLNDQYGIYKQSGWYADIMRFSASDIQRKNVIGGYLPFLTFDSKMVNIDRMRAEKAVDPYAIGFNIGCYVDFKFQIHPLELADFFTGIFCYDLSEDDKNEIHWVDNLF